ncbi:MAG: hypothetical protein Q4D13_00160 [Erysipelotrichaceae bacterium]|nr:hypothetical protein [Erysipelotrichaceae bacterium]
MFKSLKSKLLLLLGVCLIAGGLYLQAPVNRTAAVLQYVQSDDEAYKTYTDTASLRIALLENGNIVSAGTMESNRTSTDPYAAYGVSGTLSFNKMDKLVIGKPYAENVAARNIGNYAEYVRVIITKSWTTESGKDTSLDPALIELTLDKKYWVIDTDENTSERTVMYYKEILESNKQTEPFIKGIRISDEIVPVITEKETTNDNGVTVVTTTFSYEGYIFNVKAEVQAVQTHNAADAITSVWGITSTKYEDLTGLNLADGDNY